MSPPDINVEVAVLKTEVQHLRDDVGDLKDELKAMHAQNEGRLRDLAGTVGSLRDDMQALKAGKATVLGIFALAGPLAGGVLTLIGQALMKKFGL